MVISKLLKKSKDILSQPVVKLPGTNEVLTWAEIVHSVFITGNAGSGKTSGPAAWLLNDILRDETRPGALFLCVKSDERERIERAIRKAGRADDLVVISADTPYTVNPVEDELYRRGRDRVEYTQAVELLMELFLLGENYMAGGGSGEQERFWEKALRRMLSRLMMLLVLADMPVTITNMRRVLIDSFNEDDVQRYTDLWVRIETETGDAQDEAIEEYNAWYNANFFSNCFHKANAREDLSESEHDTMQQVGEYFLRTWCRISEKTKAIVEESALGLFEPWMSGILKSHFNSSTSPEVRPERIYKDGALVILDVPIVEYGIAAVYAAGILKKQFQLCMQRRNPKKETDPRICILWADEYHFLVSPQSDDKFVSMSRSTLSASVFITQSINNIKVSLGKDAAESKTKSLLANLGTQIFCGNICKDSNLYAAEMIGKTFIQTQSNSYDTNDRGSRSTNERLHYRVPPEDFQILRTGGLAHKYKVDTIMVVRGKTWSTGEPFCRVTFDQRGRAETIFQKLKSCFL